METPRQPKPARRYIKPTFRPMTTTPGLTFTEEVTLALVCLDPRLTWPKEHKRLCQILDHLDPTPGPVAQRALAHLRTTGALDDLGRHLAPPAGDAVEILGELLLRCWARRPRATPPRAVLADLLGLVGVGATTAEAHAYAALLPGLPEAGPAAAPLSPWPPTARADLGLAAFTLRNKAAHTRLLSLLELDPRLCASNELDRLTCLIELFDPSLTRKDVARRTHKWRAERDDDPLLHRVFRVRTTEPPDRAAAEARVDRLGELSGWSALPPTLAEGRRTRALRLLGVPN